MERTGKLVAIVISTLIVGQCPAAPGTIIYVDQSATGAGDGSSWDDAFNFLQDALSAPWASASPGVHGPPPEPVEVRVAAGIYRPDQGAQVTPGDRNAAFYIREGVTLLGGYGGLAGDDPDARDVERYVTILSGDLNGDDAEIDDPREMVDAPTRSDNSFSVVRARSTVTDALLDGFTITAGNTTNCGGTSCGGGGLEITQSQLTVRNCTFVHNSSNGCGAVGMIGAHVVIESCRFVSNVAEGWGGGILAQEGSATLLDCDFRGNRASKGGAVFTSHATLSCVDCTFDNNAALSAGAIEHESEGIYLTDCTFSANSADGSPSEPDSGIGGAVRIDTQSRHQSVIAGCLFEKNTASYGGAMDASYATLTGCRFVGNVAGARGGALNSRNGVSGAANCLFAGNRAAEGGAIYAICYGPPLTGCTLIGNRAEQGRSVAWYACRPGSSDPAPFTMRIANSILWDGPDAISLGDGEPPDIGITYSNVSGGWPGEGNIDVDPCFAEPGYWDPNGTPDDPNDDVWVHGDYHLKSQAGRWDPASESWVRDDVTSPCIDAGDPMSPIGHEPFPNGGIVNMGAYGGTNEASKSYFGRSVCETIVAGDINGDCEVNLKDFEIMALHWTGDDVPTWPASSTEVRLR